MTQLASDGATMGPCAFCSQFSLPMHCILHYSALLSWCALSFSRQNSAAVSFIGNGSVSSKACHHLSRGSNTCCPVSRLKLPFPLFITCPTSPLVEKQRHMRNTIWKSPSCHLWNLGNSEVLFKGVWSLRK